MDLSNQTYEVTPLATLTIHPRNPRRGDLSVIKESIERNGFYGVIVAQRSTGYVLAGNHRVMAARELGVEELPVMWLDVDDTTANRILLVDNRANDRAGYADDDLLSLLRELDEAGELSGTGFDADSVLELERITGSLAQEAGSWLDSLVEQSTDEAPLEPFTGRSSGANGATGRQGWDDPGAESSDPTAGAGLGRIGGAPPQYFSLSYMFAGSERDEVIRALTAVRAEQGLETAAQALLHLAREYLTGRDADLAEHEADEDVE